MLTLKNVTKSYQVGDFEQKALNGVSLSFRAQEFVAILGPSGSGKTTLLNMVGGLDRYDSGDLVIEGKSTQHFKDADWDSYRNHAVGFIFQSYNLINHTSVLANVELGMTLSGLSSDERRQRALEVLEQVGLKDHVYKKPNQLSGGQMQRVAIARALANNPDIIMADEPTGAIDSATSKQIMGLIQEIAKDKLVIMVTHDEGLAKTYAERTVKLKDGKVIEDTHPFDDTTEETGSLLLKKTSMAFSQALKLSFNNLRTKKFRTLITAFAGSIGIIGVAMVLALANGLNMEIDTLERSTLAQFPLQIDPFPINIEAAQQGGFGPPGPEMDQGNYEPFTDAKEVYPFEAVISQNQHINVITQDYLQFLDTLDPALYFEINAEYDVRMPLLLREAEGQYRSIDQGGGGVDFEPTVTSEEFLSQSYDIIDGRLPENANELVVVVDTANRLNIRFFSALGLSFDVESYSFDTLYALDLYTFLPDEYYRENEAGRFVPVGAYESLVENGQAIPLSIVGFVRESADSLAGFIDNGIKYHPDLEELYIASAKTSAVAAAQNASDVSVFSGQPLSPQQKITELRRIGFDDTPTQVLIYPVDFNAKETIRNALDAYNEPLPDEEQIIYTDLASLVTELTGDLINGVSYVLIAFSSISLLVSSIMIGIITYVSVLERTKEIGILRSLGARKKDVSRVFNAETTIIGFTAGVLGVGVAYLLTFPLNLLIGSLVDGIDNLAQLSLLAGISLVVISVFLTFVAGLIPSKIAANKHPVDALRIE